MPSTMLKNKVIYRQFIDSRFCKLKMLYMFKTFVSVLCGHASYINDNNAVLIIIIEDFKALFF